MPFGHTIPSYTRVQYHGGSSRRPSAPQCPCSHGPIHRRAGLPDQGHPGEKMCWYLLAVRSIRLCCNDSPVDGWTWAGFVDSASG